MIDRVFLVIINVLLPLVGSILGQQQEEGFCKLNYNTTQQCQLLQHIEGTHLR